MNSFEKKNDILRESTQSLKLRIRQLIEIILVLLMQQICNSFK